MFSLATQSFLQQFYENLPPEEEIGASPLSTVSMFIFQKQTLHQTEGVINMAEDSSTRKQANKYISYVFWHILKNPFEIRHSPLC